MTWPIRLIVAIAVVPLGGAAPYAVQLDTRLCRSLPPGQVSELGPAWADMTRYVQRCAVRGPDGRLALSVDIVRLDRAYAENYFEGRSITVVPVPVLRDATGRKVGELPEGFPADPPGRPRVRFTGWHEGFPYEIRLYEAGESAIPPHVLPSLHWNPKVGRFE